MSASITYTGSIKVFRAAVEEANDMLASDATYALIAARSAPFPESRPADLSPAKVAEILRSSQRVFGLREYKAHKSIGGKFRPLYPENIWGNINATGRGVCKIACMFVHECVHAVSHHTRDYKFSHDGDKPKYNQDTAPYWIQGALRAQHCKNLVADDLLVVELIGEDEDSAD